VSDILLILPLGGVLVLGFLYLRRVRASPAARYWGWAWLNAYAAGLLLNLTDWAPALVPTWHLPGALVPVCFLAGALLFEDRRVPRGFAAAGLAWGAARAATDAAGWTGLTAALTLPGHAVLDVATVVVLAGSLRRRNASLPERLLAPGFAVLAVVDTVDVTERVFGLELFPLILPWMALSLALFLLQVLAMVERLRESDRDQRRTLDAVLESAPAGILVEDADGRVVRMNAELADQLGVGAPDTWRGRTLRELTEAVLPGLGGEAGLRERLMEARSAPLDRAVRGFELRFQRPARKVLSVDASPLRDEPGHLAGRVWISRDVTGERELEEQLRQAQKLEGVGRLAGGVAHDFNNLLTVISASTDLATMELPDDHPAREALESVEEATEHGAGLTRQLLSFARRQVVEPRVVDANGVLSEAEKMLRRLIGEDVLLQLEPRAGLWPVRIDPHQLMQVLVNLAVNARDAMPGGGVLTIATHNVAAGRPETPIGLREGDAVQMVVRDSGHGMDEHVLEHLFEPFFTTKRAGKGTGLGLPTCQRIVGEAGGTITCSSAPGRGTAFSIWLPRCPEEPVSADAEALPGAAHGEEETVLVVEDDRLVRGTTVALLRARGYRVLEATGASDALARLEAEPGPCHLLLTDVVMPGLSGPQLAERVRALRPETRVLFTTGYADDAVVRSGVSSGEVDLLQKPYTAEALARKVRAVLDGD